MLYDAPGDPRYILSEPRVGYRMVMRGMEERGKISASRATLSLKFQFEFSVLCKVQRNAMTGLARAETLW